jgi:hypothetical protein
VTPNDNGTFTVTVKLADAVAVTVSGTDTIRIAEPSNPPTSVEKALLEHENGHAELDRNEFQRDAQAKTLQIFNGVRSIEFKGTGDTKQAALDAATASLKAEIDRRAELVANAISSQAKVLGDMYDDLTDHGKNDKGPIDSAKKGVDAALAKRDSAASAGSTSNSPDPQKPHGSTSPDPATISYDAGLGAFTFGGNTTLQYGGDSLDPILGRGVVEVNPMLLIGLQDNGTYHLADTEMSIFDEQTGDRLLKAYLLGLAYMPSSLPGFAGMIEGSLGILPAFTGNTDNFLDSPLLSGLQAAADAGEPTEFWFYTSSPRFDADGNLLAGADPIDGSMKIGIGTPEPESVIMLLSIVVILALSRGRLKKSYIRYRSAQ